MRIEEKYPCGYEIKIHIGLFQSIGFKYSSTKGCPIHGKKCNQLKGEHE